MGPADQHGCNSVRSTQGINLWHIYISQGLKTVKIWLWLVVIGTEDVGMYVRCQWIMLTLSWDSVRYMMKLLLEC